MALIPPFFLDCVVAIGFRDADDKINYGGTGFLFGRRVDTDPADGKGLYGLFLVTNRHVLDGSHTAFLRFNPEADGAAQVFDAPLVDSAGSRLWFALPDASIDIAVMSINAEILKQAKIKFAFFGEDLHLLTHKDAAASGLSEGDGVFVLGFPMGNVGEERNYVVVRSGIVARIRDSLSGAVPQFLIDATVFPGNSGGPVVTRPEITAINGTSASQRAALIGVVAAYLPYHDVAVSQQTRRPRIVFEENSGLAAVVPIDRVVETVDAFIAATSTPLPSDAGVAESGPAAVVPAAIIPPTA